MPVQCIYRYLSWRKNYALRAQNVTLVGNGNREELFRPTSYAWISFQAGNDAVAPALKKKKEKKTLSLLLVIVCCVSIQEKFRRSPKGFVRNGNERERGGGGGGH